MKRVWLAAAAALLALLLAGCGGGGGKTGVPAADVAAAVADKLGKGDALTESDGAFLGLTGADAEALGDHSIRINRYGANIDEFGVFRADGDGMDAKELRETAEEYLSLRLAVWMDEYMPEEKPKLENAEVRAKGDYVMYCILSDADRAEAFSVFEAQLK